jgi:hypothetical protein
MKLNNKRKIIAKNFNPGLKFINKSNPKFTPGLRATNHEKDLSCFVKLLIFQIQVIPHRSFQIIPQFY